jgi:uncharacterized protein YqfA (UPF0365 family)
MRPLTRAEKQIDDKRVEIVDLISSWTNADADEAQAEADENKAAARANEAHTRKVAAQDRLKELIPKGGSCCVETCTDPPYVVTATVTNDSFLRISRSMIVRSTGP